MTSRRLFLMIAGASLASCAQQNAGSSSIPQQVLDDVGYAFAGLTAALAGVNQANPTLISPPNMVSINSYLTAGQTLLSQVRANLAAASTGGMLQQIEADLNAALSILASLPIPPPYSTVITAAAIIAPELEAIINQQLGRKSMRAAAFRSERASGMDLPQARQVVRQAASGTIGR
jgi:hypothetical protein